MKHDRIALILMAISMGLLSGCNHDNSHLAMSTEQTKDISEENASIESVVLENENEEQCINPYFFPSDITKQGYTGYMTDEVGDYIDNAEGKYVLPIYIEIEEVAHREEGSIYELKFREGTNVPEERMSVGHFYVQADKIYKLPSYDTEGISTLIETGAIPEASRLVCQEEGMEDRKRWIRCT